MLAARSMTSAADEWSEGRKIRTLLLDDDEK